MKNRNINNTVAGAIVIGGHFQGLGAVRALARENLDIVLIDHEPCLAKCSKFVNRFFKSPLISDEKNYLNFLIDIAEKKQLFNYTIFPTDDETVFFIAQNHSKLSQYFKLITPPWDIIQYAYNKKLSYKLAEQLEIPIPRTWYPNTEEDLEEVDQFPVILKPAVMRTFFKKTGKKVLPVQNKDELYAAYHKAEILIPRDEILLQEQLSNVTKNLFSYCPVIYQDQVLGRIIAKRPRQHPMDFGQASTYAVTVNCDEIEKLGNRFLNAIHYYGLGEVEFIYDERSNQYRFLEVNPRIWGWHTLALSAGINLCYMAYLGSNQQHIEKKDYDIDIKWCRLITDVPVVLSEMFKGHLTLREYLSSMRGSKEWAVWSLKDPKPFLSELFLLPYLICKRGF